MASKLFPYIKEIIQYRAEAHSFESIAQILNDKYSIDAKRQNVSNYYRRYIKKMKKINSEQKDIIQPSSIEHPKGSTINEDLKPDLNISPDDFKFND